MERTINRGPTLTQCQHEFACFVERTTDLKSRIERIEAGFLRFRDVTAARMGEAEQRIALADEELTG